MIHRVEYRPFVVELKLRPVLEPECQMAHTARSLRFKCLTSPRASIADALASTSRIRDEYLRRAHGPRSRRLEELIQLSGGFATDPVVAAEIARTNSQGTPSRRGRGRPRGMTIQSQEVGTALYCLVQDAVDCGWSAEDALEDLADRKFEQLRFDRLKGLYYRMRRVLRPDPLMFFGPGREVR
jgi:hypothetical protein